MSERIKLATARRASTVTVTDPFANKLTFSEPND
jgi:hypothetical protein